jgi:thiosulfate dehydrogenase
MHRVLTAARFIKARMPLGQADLSDDQAYDVAAYINSHPRPQMSGLEADYPDRSKKPVDSPYPPYADPFPIEQHRLGPFAPIRAYYEGQSEAAGAGSSAR